MNVIIIGLGEIGSAYYDILKNIYDVYRIDIDKNKSDVGKKREPKNVDVMHICTRYNDKWAIDVITYHAHYQPEYLDIMSTVPPGSSKKLGIERVVHSTTRGLHPNLKQFILKTPKHIGPVQDNPVTRSFFYNYWYNVGIDTVFAPNSTTTELAHILSNSLYGIQILFAREMEDICRKYGVDYYHAVMRYSETHNTGYERIGIKSKYRPILTPPGDKIGGHCVVQGAQLIPTEIQGELMKKLSK